MPKMAKSHPAKKRLEQIKHIQIAMDKKAKQLYRSIVTEVNRNYIFPMRQLDSLHLGAFIIKRKT